MKKCNKCGEAKPLEEFHKDKSKKDGRTSNCKTCVKQCQEANREKISEQKKQYYKDNREKAKQYYEANREKIAERNKQYRKDNREKIAEQQKQYYKDNREKITEHQKQYYQDNKEVYKLRNQKRRAIEVNASGHCTNEQLQARLDYHGNRCVYCGSEENLTIEHMIPLSKGGSNWPANLAPACKSCNCSKGAHKTFQEFKG